jgi:hypothetical protein
MIKPKTQDILVIKLYRPKSTQYDAVNSNFKPLFLDSYS